MLGDPANAKSPFFSVDINWICMRFHLYSFSRVFSNRHVFGEYAKRIPAYIAVNGTVTEDRNVSKCVRF